MFRTVHVLCLLLSLFGCRSDSARGSAKLAVLSGGSGEDDTDNFLIQDLRDFGRQLRSRGWEVRATVGEEKNLLPGSVPATNANLRAMNVGALEKARAGDQVLLVLHSHGREREGTWGQKSHSIVSEDVDDSGNDPGFDLDVLEPALLAAHTRGAHVALVDLSCYSGSTQALRGPDCTISLASPRYVSLCSGRAEERLFTSGFLKLPPAGTPRDIEAQYLQARREDHESINVPRISTRATPLGEAWDELLFQADPLDVSEDLREYRAGKPFDPRGLLAELDRWLQRGGADPTASNKLRRSIADRIGALLKLRARLETMIPPLAQAYDSPSLELGLPSRGPAQLSGGNLAEFLDRTSPKGDHDLDGYSDVQRRLVEAIAAERDSLAERFGRPLDEFRLRREDFEARKSELEGAAGQVFDLERELYDRLATSTGTGCSSFSL